MTLEASDVVLRRAFLGRVRVSVGYVPEAMYAARV
jgi:hypothetical protein